MPGAAGAATACLQRLAVAGTPRCRGAAVPRCRGAEVPRAPLRFPRDRSSDLSGEYCLEPQCDGYWRLASQSQVLYDMTVSAQSRARRQAGA